MDKIQTYNDGVVKIYGTPNTLKGTLRYEERTVGIQRYNRGLQNGIRIDKVARCPSMQGIFTDDIADLTDGFRYEIKQVQYPKDVTPPSMDLSLQRLTSRNEPHTTDEDGFAVENDM